MKSLSDCSGNTMDTTNRRCQKTRRQCCNHMYSATTSVVSTSTDSTQQSGNSRLPCARLVVEENHNINDVQGSCSQGIGSVPSVSRKGDGKTTIKQSLHEESNVLVSKPVDRYVSDAGKGRLKQMIQASISDEHLKTQSSSGLTQVVIPASSNDSSHEISVDTKSFKECMSENGMSTCNHFKCNLEQPADGSPVMHTSRKIAPEMGQGSVGFARANDFDNLAISNNARAETFSELNDALKVARTVAKDMEREFGSCRDASGSSCSREEKNDETNHRSSLNSVDLHIELGLIDTGCSRLLCNDKGKYDSLQSTKEMVHPELLARSEQLCSNMCFKSVNEVREGCCGDEFSYILKKPRKASQRQAELENSAVNDESPFLPKIDLNENIMADEEEFYTQPDTTISIHSESLSKPIPVKAKFGIPIGLYMLYSSPEALPSGWKGSAATSAFCTTSNFRSYDKSKATLALAKNGSCISEKSNVKGIDLNLSAGIDSDTVIIQDKHAAEEPSMESSSKRAKKLNLDLNSAYEIDCNSSNPIAPLSLRHSVRDFDLNISPSFADKYSYTHPTTQASQPSTEKTSDHPELSFIRKARNSDFPSRNPPANSPDMNHWKISSHDFAKSPPAQTQQVIPVPQWVPYSLEPPPLAFHYSNGLCINPNNSWTLCPHSLLPYVANPQGTNNISQFLGSSASSNFANGAPNSMEVSGRPVPGLVANNRPDFDVSGRTTGEDGIRDRYTRQFFPVNSSSVIEHKSATHQSALTARTMKRKEPEGKWDSTPAWL